MVVRVKCAAGRGLLGSRQETFPYVKMDGATRYPSFLLQGGNCQNLRDVAPPEGCCCRSSRSTADPEQ